MSSHDQDSLASTTPAQRPTSSAAVTVQVDDATQPPNSAVNVQDAKAQFHQLQHTLSRHSQLTREKTHDVESNDDDEFDLVQYLRTTQSENSKAGIKSKHVGVSWTDLEVLGVSSLSLHIRTFPDKIIELFLVPIFKIKMAIQKPPSRKLLQNFTGCAKPGQMVLVLGRPGSGCSTFLKAIANQRVGFVDVLGDVKYGGIDHQEFAKRYLGEAIYTEEDDVHLPTLTVKQTLEFALSLKSPGKRLPGYSKKQLNKQILDVFLKMLGIPHTADTLVGSPNVRGVSGGERKRVSIAEGLCSRAAVLSGDNCTRGLDASTALDYVKCMRVWTDLLGMTTFMSLYQAGEGIYDQFDKVLLIDQGRCVYYGPCDKARQYFLDLGFKNFTRQTTADFLSGCTDPNLDRLAPGRDQDSVPSTPERLEEAYKQSSIYQDVLREKQEYDEQVASDNRAAQEFRQAVMDEKNRGVSSNSVYTTSFLDQVNALTQRQFQMIIGNTFDVFMSFATAIAIAFMTGSSFYQLPQTAAGAFSRGGLLFIGLLFNALTAFNELPTQMGNRPILYKQTNLAFYRPSALSLAQLLSDIPLSFARVLIFSIILYFMGGLASTAGAFFTFFINVYLGYLAMSALFRIFGTTCRDYNVAARLAAVIISALVVFAGYVIPRFALRRWLFWITYINPLYYGFSAVMINEFQRVSLACVGSYITPRNPPGQTLYPDNVGPNQVCTLPGAKPGSQIVSGTDYIRASFGYQGKDLWLYFGIVCIFFVGLVVLTLGVIEIFQHGRFSSALTIIKKPNKEEEQLNQRLKDRRQMSEREESQQIQVASKPFTWEKVSYTVPVKGGQRQLLDDVYGYCKPGTLTALMGASGAGKTTLLDVLADRKSIGVISGDRLINGRSIGVEFQRGCGYAEQQDIHDPYTTVREALRFSAYLRQPAHVAKAEKDAYVEDIIELLEMQEIADAMVGFPEFGLGMGDRKRVTIGVELAARPDLLLFLDEPTSGLDGQTAYNVVRFLKKLAAAGQAILCTIHQPNALLFEQFDRLLLLERGGRTVYFGPIGPNAQHIVDYFGSNGAECPPSVNMAEYMLDAIGAGSMKRVGPRDWADIYLDSQLFQDNVKEIETINQRCGAEGVDEASRKGTEYATTFMYQLEVVVKRTLIGTWRQPDYQWTRLIQHFCISLITGLCFLQLDTSIASIQYRIFGIFIATVLPAIIIAQVEPFFIMARTVFIREDSSKMYSGPVFAIAQIVSEIPFGILCSIVYFICFYYPTGFNTESSRAGYFYAMILITELFAITLGQAVAALSPSIYIASLANPPLILAMSLFCGVTQPYPNLPHFWKSWMYWINPTSYLVAGLIANELEGLDIKCKPSEFAVFQPPSNQTCAQWADSFANYYGGYLDNPTAMGDCRYCQYRNGPEFFTPLNIKFSDRGRNIGVLFAFVAFNAIVTIAASKYIKYANR